MPVNNPKIENLLNLALEATPQERERSQNLNVGFDREERQWELIVKYNGDLSGLRSRGIRVTELQNEYAILLVPESLIDGLANMTQIEYIEKPKRLYFAVNQGRTASCITGVQNQRFGLFGVKEQTQKEVADKLGISQSYISRLEKRIILRLKREILRMS